MSRLMVGVKVVDSMSSGLDGWAGEEDFLDPNSETNAYVGVVKS